MIAIQSIVELKVYCEHVISFLYYIMIVLSISWSVSNVVPLCGHGAWLEVDCNLAGMV